MATNERCTAVKKDGTPCKGQAWRGGVLCYRHSPELAERQAEGLKRGGRNSAKVVRARRMVPRRLEPVFKRLEALLEAVEEGGVTTNQATAIASVSRAMVSVVMHGELEERLSKVEEKARALGVKV